MRESGPMIMTYQFEDNACVELAGGNVRFWFSFGAPDFEGTLEGLKDAHPWHFQRLLDDGVIRAK